MVWTSEYIAQWHHVKQQYLADLPSVTIHKEMDQQRLSVQQEMLQVLTAFLDGRITLKEFNRIFQQKTHMAWSVFHVRGMSGGLFLNKLIKYIPNEDHLTQLLRVILRVPKTPQDGHWWMQAFTQFLESLITSQQVSRGQLQPARIPFFLSVWWHLQAPGHWPISYLSVRQVLRTEEEKKRAGHDPIEAYFAFRTRFLSLAQELGLSSWALEYLATWSGQHDLRGGGKERLSSVNEKGCAPISLWKDAERGITQADGPPVNTSPFE